MGLNEPMPSYVAFLRAINLGPNRKFPKDAIKACVESCGFTDVATYINTGNATRPPRNATVQIARDGEELTSAALARHYLLLLKEEPSPEVLALVAARDTDVNRTVVRHRAAHLLLGPGYQTGTTDPLGVEKLLGVTTNRNLNVVSAIARTWCG